MAKTNPGGKEYASSESGDAYEAQHPDDATKRDPAAELQEKQIQLTQLKAHEKRLQDEIARLTAHNAALKTLEGQLSVAASETVKSARGELTKFVESGMKALDDVTKRTIVEKRKAADADVTAASAKSAKDDTDAVAKQEAVAAKQQQMADATDKYKRAKDLPTRVKQASADLVKLRGNVESLVKGDEFVQAGFWLFELDEELKKAETLAGGSAAISKAWQELETVSTELGAAEDALTEALARQAASKTALDDARKDRVAKILDALKEPPGSKAASAA